MDFVPELRGNPLGWVRDMLYGKVEEPRAVFLSRKQGMNMSAELDFAEKEKLLSAEILQALREKNISIQGFYHVSKW